MATRTVRNRRRPDEDAAPDADEYTSRSSRRGGGDDEDRTERRPRRGRGELPGRSKEPEVEYPESKRALTRLSDDEWTALAEALDLDPDKTDESEMWEVIESKKAEEDNEKDEEPPSRRSRRASKDDDDKDESPRRGRGRSKDDDEEDTSSRRGGRGRGRSSKDDDDDDDDDEDRPTRKRRAGFEGYKKTREKTFTDDFRVTDEETLAKFLEDEPFDSWAEHHLFDELNEGQRIWICIEDDCPICKTGHKPKPFSAYNIVVIPEEGEPKVEVLRSGPAMSKELEKKASLKTGPLSKEYYSLYLVKPERGKKGPTTTHADVVRERDVKEEWKFTPFTEDELDDFMEQTVDPDTYVKFPTVAQLKAVAKKLRESD